MATSNEILGVVDGSTSSGMRLPDSERTREAAVGMLARNWLLVGAPVEELQALATASEERRYTPGEIIFREGAVSDGIHLVEGGVVRIATHTVKGETALASVTAGEWFGEMGVIDGSPRSATASAGTLTIIRFIPTDPFLDLLQRVPAVPLRLLVLLANRLRRTNGLLADLPGAARTTRAFDD